MSLADIIGATGVFILLLAFVLSGLNKINPKGPLYYALNFIGAAMACFASYLINYFPFIVLEGTWTLVSAVGLIRSSKSN